MSTRSEKRNQRRNRGIAARKKREHKCDRCENDWSSKFNLIIEGLGYYDLQWDPTIVKKNDLVFTTHVFSICSTCEMDFVIHLVDCYAKSMKSEERRCHLIKCDSLKNYPEFSNGAVVNSEMFRDAITEWLHVKSGIL